MWSPPTPGLTFGILRSFEIRYYITSRPENSLQFIQNIPSTDKEYEITGLMEFTNYSVEVSAITIDNGPFSSPVTVVTDEDSKMIM